MEVFFHDFGLNMALSSGAAKNVSELNRHGSFIPHVDD